MLDGVFRTVKRTLATAIAGGMSSLADSQDENADEELDEAEIGSASLSLSLSRSALVSSAAQRPNSNTDVSAFPLPAERIPIAPLKSLIAQLATRTNYGLALNDVDDLPEGVKEVPAALQIWAWEVKDDDMLPTEMRAKLERRRREREEVRSTFSVSYLALSARRVPVSRTDAHPLALVAGQDGRRRALSGPVRVGASRRPERQRQARSVYLVVGDGQG